MNNYLKKNSVQKVRKYIHKIDKNTKIIELDKTAKTAKDAAISLNVEVGSIIKSLIFKSDNYEKYFLCLVSGDKTVSLKKLSNITNATIVKAEAKEVKNITGYSIGGVPPIAHKRNIPTYIDESLKRYENMLLQDIHIVFLNYHIKNYVLSLMDTL